MSVNVVYIYTWTSVIDKLYRDDPVDFYFDIDYAGYYKLENTLYFSYTSHEKITKEVYVRWASFLKSRKA